MWKRGIFSEQEYLQLGQEQRRYSGARVAYNLLDVGEHPTPDQIRVFEDVSFTLFTSNGTTRTTFRNRFHNVDEAALQCVANVFPHGSEIKVQDRAVSHGLTSLEFAQKVFALYPQATFEASDLLLSLIELTLPSGEIFIAEPNGVPLQYLKPPFAVPLSYPESKRYPVNRWIAARALQRFERLQLPKNWTQQKQAAGGTVRVIPYIHPEAAALMRVNPKFRFVTQSVFAATPERVHVIRTMNIFNRAYFPEDQLKAGSDAIYDSLHPHGIWIVGRTLEQDFSNHVTFLQRGEQGWEILGRIGSGSEMEELVAATALPR